MQNMLGRIVTGQHINHPLSMHRQCAVHPRKLHQAVDIKEQGEKDRSNKMRIMQVANHLLCYKLAIMQQILNNKVKNHFKLQNIPLFVFPFPDKLRGYHLSYSYFRPCDRNQFR